MDAQELIDCPYFVDSRDVIKLCDELESDLEDIQNEIAKLGIAAGLMSAYLVDSDNFTADATEALIERIEREYIYVQALNGGDALQKNIDNFAEKSEEFKKVKEFVKQGETCSDWIHGITFIHEYKFKDYARDLAEDLHGEAIHNASWPFDCIDWEKAARDLKVDYTVIEFEETTYYVR